MAATSESPEFAFRSLLLPFYVPSGLSFVGLGMILPILPLYARDLGAGIVLASFVVGLFGLGNLVFNIPAGLLNSRFDSKRVMLVSLALEVVFIAAAASARSPAILGLYMFFLGGSRTTFFVTRLGFFRSLVPSEFRGRSLAIVGGENRFGKFVGPILGGFIAKGFGYEWALLGCALLMTVAFIAMLVWVPSQPSDSKPEAPGPGSLSRVSTILKENTRTFATAGLAIIVLQLLRTAREVLIPLMGEAKGLDVSEIGLVFGLVFLVELLLFYPAGIAMDRWGRKATAVPCLILFALGLGLLPLAVGFLSLVLAAVVTGIGNGLGSGLNMTLTTDFAPKKNPAEFIGVWRFIVDFGTSGGPFAVGAIAGVLSLGASSVAIAIVGIGGAAVMYFLVPEPLRRQATDHGT